MKFIKYIILLVFITACNAPRVVYDYDERANFREFDTYRIYPDLLTNLNQLDEQRLIRIFSEELAAKGISNEGAPKMYVNFYAEEYETPSRSSIGIGVGGTGRNMGMGVSGGVPIGGADGNLQLTIDFIDVENDALIWQAVVEGQFDRNLAPERREARLRAMVQKALDKYPPR